MMLRLAAMGALSACGDVLPVQHEIALTCTGTAACDELAAEVARLGCLDVRVGENAPVTVAALREDDFRRFSWTNKIGMWLPETREILLHIDDASCHPGVLAHEIGHALGLEHTEGGIMAPAVPCLHAPVAARELVEALCVNNAPHGALNKGE